MPSASPTKKVVITIPLSKRDGFLPDEELSLRHLERHLGGFDRVFIAPPSREVSRPGYGVRRFDERYFGSVGAYNSLMLSRGFYDAFGDYEFMLHYHLDALVFSDRLLEWCDAGYDYLAPPWIKCEALPWLDVPRIGNGGFSLRRIRAFRAVFDSRKLAVDPERDWRNYARMVSPLRRLLAYPRRYLRRHWWFNNVDYEIRSFLENGRNEDMFWSDEARKYLPGFRAAPVEVARRFAFEVEPRTLYALNGGELPFGCHAFGRYDRGFWEPFFLK